MKYNPGIHHRRSIRLQGFDYSQAGAYFVSICTQNRECLFGEIVDGKMVLNDAGRIVQAVWDDLPNHYLDVELDECVVMPNHVHGIVVIVGAGLKPAPTTRPASTTTGTIKRYGLPEIVRAWKTFSARRINETRKTPGIKIWQRNYYEHIIRNENKLNRIREYIQNNPMKWEFDRENPNVGAGFKPAPTPAPTGVNESWQI
jgi:REP element-mobilizing transposase RayT